MKKLNPVILKIKLADRILRAEEMHIRQWGRMACVSCRFLLYVIKEGKDSVPMCRKPGNRYEVQSIFQWFTHKPDGVNTVNNKIWITVPPNNICYDYKPWNTPMDWPT